MRFLFDRRTIHVYSFQPARKPGLNVLLSMLIACIIGGVAGGIPLVSAPEGTQTVMQLLTGGFASNATTALAYILLGTFATCIATTGLADILSKKLSRLLGGHKLVGPGLQLVFNARRAPRRPAAARGNARSLS